MHTSHQSDDENLFNIKRRRSAKSHQDMKIPDPRSQDPDPGITVKAVVHCKKYETAAILFSKL
jgi:hypothetical protein